MDYKMLNILDMAKILELKDDILYKNIVNIKYNIQLFVWIYF